MRKYQKYTFVGPDGREVPGKRQINGDGTPGGWVAVTAKIDPSAVIEIDAVVEPGAYVGPGIRLRSGYIVPAGTKLTL
jgi:UDP-3-O-[3-hydroxymyristoyl] glucosamine N-acyltransferase